MQQNKIYFQVDLSNQFIGEWSVPTPFIVYPQTLKGRAGHARNSILTASLSPKFRTAVIHFKDNGLSPLWLFLCQADWPFMVSILLVAYHQPLTICSLCFMRQLFVAVWNTFISLGIYVLAAMPTSIVKEISF